MKKIVLLVSMLVIALTLSGCLYSNITIPLDTDADKTVLGNKTGTSNCYSILWLVAWGDAGSAAAAKNGNISTINHMDTRNVTVLFGAFVKQTTIVYGN